MKPAAANASKSPVDVQKSPGPVPLPPMITTSRQDGLCSDLQLRVLLCVTERMTRWQFTNLSAPYWRLYIMDGHGAVVRWNARDIPLDPACAWLIPPDTRFGAELTQPAAQCYVHFTLSPAFRNEPGIHRVPLTPALKTWHRRATSAVAPETGGIAWHLLVLHALEGLPSTALQTTNPDARVQRVLDHLMRDLGANHTLAALAEIAGMNPRAFIRLFHQETGETPMACLRSRRIALACDLLHHSDRSIEEIAAATGFCDRYHFSKIFRRLRSTTPAAFRIWQHAAPAKIARR